MKKKFDVVVFGATGFTGRLVAEYLNRTHGSGGPVAWAMAGRNLGKLGRVRSEIGAAESLPLLAADASDARALLGLVQQAKVGITTVGPYQLHGEPLLAACAQAGTDYVDLCGEPLWMAQMIPRFDARARAARASSSRAGSIRSPSTLAWSSCKPRRSGVSACRSRMCTAACAC